jgi:argininosuccinate lyase
MLDAAAKEYTGRPIGLAGSDLSEVTDPRSIVETRTAAGGAAPAVVEGMAASCAAQAAELRAAVRAQRAAFAAAERILLAAAGSLAGGPPEEGTSR